MLFRTVAFRSAKVAFFGGMKGDNRPVISQTSLSPTRQRGTLLLFFLLTIPSFAGADNWPRLRGPYDDGISRETGWTHNWPADKPPELWRHEVGTGYSSVVVSNGKLCTVGNHNNVDTVYCLDAATGKSLWKYSYDAPLDDRFFDGGPTSTPTIDGEHVYALAREGDLFCLDITTGEVRWQMNLIDATEVRVPGWGFGASPVVYGDRLILNAGGAGMAIDKHTGKVVWESDDGEAGYNSPVLTKYKTGGTERDAAIFASGKYYMAVDVVSGELLWQQRWLTRFGCNASQPLVDGSRILISSGYNRGAALLSWTDAEPTVVWQHKDFQNQFNSSLLIDGHVYGIDGDTTSETSLKCLELATGKIKWQQQGTGSGSLTAADGKLIILTESGELMVARANSDAFKPLARASVLKGTCWTVPILANGQLYCRSSAGTVVCLDLRENTKATK